MATAIDRTVESHRRRPATAGEAHPHDSRLLLARDPRGAARSAPASSSASTGLRAAQARSARACGIRPAATTVDGARTPGCRAAINAARKESAASFIPPPKYRRTRTNLATNSQYVQPMIRAWTRGIDADLLQELYSTGLLVGLLVDEELEKAGVPHALFSFLGWIARLQPVTPGTLAAETGLPPTTIRDYVRRLVERGDVRKIPNPTDGRSYYLVLTRKGQTLADRGWPAVVAAFERMAPHLERPPPSTSPRRGSFGGGQARARGNTRHDAIERRWTGGATEGEHAWMISRRDCSLLIRSPALRRRARAAALGTAAGARRADEGRADRGALLRPRLGVRAQTGRHPLHRDQGRPRHAPALAKRPEPQRALSGGRGGTRRRPGEAPRAGR